MYISTPMASKRYQAQPARMNSISLTCLGLVGWSGTFWQRYEKKQKLGEGTSAIVRKCVERSTGKAFAVKVVRTRDEEITFHVAAG